MTEESPTLNVNDPAAPASEVEVLGDIFSARDLANFGVKGRQTFDKEIPVASPTLEIDWSKVVAFLRACETSSPRVGYKLGAKISSDAAKPGSDFTHVDCSGFVRAAVRRSTDPKATNFPDGSVVQHDWVKASGFAASTIADGSLSDGVVRIAFLSPNDSANNIGHVALVRDGKTIESHGGKGPDSRIFDGSGWQSKAKLYVLKR